MREKAEIRKDTLSWFSSKYKQTEEECFQMLLQAQKDNIFTIDQIHDGCIELARGSIIEMDLPTHIRILAELCNKGVKSSVAGKKLREAG